MNREAPTPGRRLVLGVGLLGLLALLTAPHGRADEDSLDWITSLPGVVRQADKTVATGSERAFTARDGRAAFDAVRAGLKQRGWTIAKATDLDLGVGAVSTLRASRDGQRIKVTLNTATGQGLLVVTLSARDGAAAGPGRGSPAVAAGSVQALVGSLLGGAPTADGEGLALFDNGVEQTHDCRGRRVSVNGNGSRLTFTGECPAVTANGNDNTLAITGHIGQISAVGSRNTIWWSPAANPTAPRVSDLGRGNRIERAGGGEQR